MSFFNIIVHPFQSLQLGQISIVNSKVTAPRGHTHSLIVDLVLVAKLEATFKFVDSDPDVTEATSISHTQILHIIQQMTMLL
jgi:hypothetical protein